jgi:hypothetical protein
MSLEKLLKHGWKLSGNSQEFLLNKMKDEIIFNRKIHMKISYIFAKEISLRNDQGMMVDDLKELSIKQANLILGHMNRLNILQTTKKCEWKCERI